MSEQSLKDKTVKGVGWSAIDNVAQKGIAFLVSIVLARLITPDEFGLLGIIAIFTSICETLIEGGFVTALIRKKDATEEDYNTVFILNLGLSLFLYLVIFFCAPLIAAFFERVELVALVRVASLGMVVSAFALVQQARLTKRIDFKTQTRITLSSSVFSGVVGVVMALLGFGVWSLVAQQLSKYLLRTLRLWSFNRWKPSWSFSKRSAKELFGFGWKIMLSGVINSLWGDLYQVIVARFYSPATLGQYSRAKTFSSLFSGNLTSVVQRVTYPALSGIQDDKQSLIRAYRRIIKTTMFVTAFCMFFLGAVSEPMIYCLIGPKWNEAAMYLPLICVAGSMYPLHAINLNMLSVQGRSDLFLGLEIVKKILFIGPLMVGALVGIMPMLWVNVLISFVNFFLNSYFSGKLLGYSSWMQLRDVAPSYGLAFLVAVSVWFLKYIPISYWVVFPLQIVVGSGVFFTVCRLTKMQEYDDAKRIVAPFVQKLVKMKNRVLSK